MFLTQMCGVLLELLSIYCPKLKSLDLDLIFLSEKYLINILKSIKHFQKLKRLKIANNSHEFSLTNETNLVLDELFKSLENLTHLTLKCELNDEFFEVINIYSKNLLYLNINSNQIITDSTFNLLLSKNNSSKLQTIIINDRINSSKISDESIDELMKICPKIKYININGVTLMSRRNWTVRFVNFLKDHMTLKKLRERKKIIQK